jgi:hypothetical protein
MWILRPVAHCHRPFFSLENENWLRFVLSCQVKGTGPLVTKLSSRLLISIANLLGLAKSWHRFSFSANAKRFRARGHFS